MSWLDRIMGGRDAPEDTPRGDPDRVAEVEALLAEMRPSFLADGGDVRLRAVENGWVVVSLRGACEHCSFSTVTLRGALEPELRRRFDWVEGIREE